MSTPAIILWDQAYNRNKDGNLPRAVVNAIRTHMDNHTLNGWIKQETLADYTGLSVRQVRRQITANVEAGWLEVTNVGNSSGLASSYRLAFPKADMDVRIDPVSSAKADIYDREGGHGCPVKADTDVRPTTPVTSPGSSPKRRTTPEKADMDVRIPDPFSGSGDYPATTTTESNADMDVRLGQGDSYDPFAPATDAEQVEILREINETETADMFGLSLSASWSQAGDRFGSAAENRTPWPKDKPLPNPWDPFTTYVDAETGEPLPVPTRGKEHNR